MIAELKTMERAQPLSDRVYAALRQLLRAGRIPPGQPLQEAALAEQLGVSRTPVREALRHLESDGLVVPDGRGYTVPALTGRDVDEIYALRFLVEPEALRLVAEGAGEGGKARLAPLREALADMAAAHAAGDGAAFMDANYRYRDAWTALVPNRRLVRAIELYADHVRYLRVFTLDDPQVRAVVLRGLKRLTSALEAGDGTAAAQAMRAHLEQARRILVEKSSQRE
jgi:DNA-binding GntR family transcriptional regulator